MNKKPIEIIPHFDVYDYFDADTHILRYNAANEEVLFCFTDFFEMLALIRKTEFKMPYDFRLLTFIFSGIKNFEHKNFLPKIACGKPGEVSNYGADGTHFNANFVNVKKLDNHYFCEMDFENGLGEVEFEFDEIAFFELCIYDSRRNDGEIIYSIDPENKNWINMSDLLPAIEKDWRKAFADLP